MGGGLNLQKCHGRHFLCKKVPPKLLYLLYLYFSFNVHKRILIGCVSISYHINDLTVRTTTSIPPYLAYAHTRICSSIKTNCVAVAKLPTHVISGTDIEVKSTLIGSYRHFSGPVSSTPTTRLRAVWPCHPGNPATSTIIPCGGDSTQYHILCGDQG